MFCRLNLGPQDSLLSQVFLRSTTRCHFTERRGVMFLLRLVCAHLINVNSCCYCRCYGKSRILLIRFLKSRCFNAGNRVRLFQDSIPKCFRFTILPLKKKCLLQPNITFFEYKTTLIFLLSAFVPFISPPPPLPFISPKPTQNPLRTCTSPGLITGILWYVDMPYLIF